uniref:Uncharacterized protein n=1 Tax=Candidatus Kentrum sp. FW TaxID=2126338 RepID=A0A450SVY6_9GAMM|nr:MAG: hypothetical protein BECKFW1821A_GA0114235_107817 [Candidatus Kentron sp. FW]
MVVLVDARGDPLYYYYYFWWMRFAYPPYGSQHTLGQVGWISVSASTNNLQLQMRRQPAQLPRYFVQSAWNPGKLRRYLAQWTEGLVKLHYGPGDCPGMPGNCPGWSAEGSKSGVINRRW